MPARLLALFASLLAALSTVAEAKAASPRASAGVDAGQAPPRIFLHDPQALLRNKHRWGGDRKADPAVARLFADADAALGEKPFSVVVKAQLPPSGDRHDYLSLAPYAWPDPRKSGGLPYLIRDGQVNPERDTIADHRQLARICTLAETLGLAYFFSEDERYAAQAALLLRTFFVDPATRMNPNLRFAQIVKGKDDGRAAGIIDGVALVHLVDGLGLLAPSKAWSAADGHAMDGWLRDYLTWLRESDLGRRESRAGNNHGTWYDVQVVALALATGQGELAVETLSFARKRRIGRQVEPDGQQSLELQRTRPWHYAVYNLEAMSALASLGERAGVDLWHYQTPDGRSLGKAIAWLLPFALGGKPWTLHDIDGIKPEALSPVLRQAAAALGDPQLIAAATKLGPPREHRVWLWAP